MKMNLKNKLILITLINVSIVTILVSIILPKLLMPIFEKNIYENLKRPHAFINQNSRNSIDDIAYFFIQGDEIVDISTNYAEIINTEPINITKKITDSTGKLNIDNKTYYYYLTGNGPLKRVTITDSTYINKLIRTPIIIITIITFLSIAITTTVLFIWSKKLVKKIENLKEKVDNIENKDYKQDFEIKDNDEILVLYNAIENMKNRLNKNEKEKNEMFQNISHDLKTPITVIKSHIEALEDNVINKKVALNVLNEQSDKLKEKVNSLLYINKLDYINEKYEMINITEILMKSKTKFELVNKKIKWEVISDESLFYGNNDMWEVVIDNIIDNFIRYAKKEIKIEISNETLTFYNDGDNIDESIINDILEPYKTGSGGNFGLGLAIVKKTLNIFKYNIQIKNQTKGVEFIITKQ